MIHDHAALLCKSLQPHRHASGCDLQRTTVQVPAEFFDENALKLALG